jgi:hypothetical protein
MHETNISKTATQKQETNCKPEHVMAAAQYQLQKEPMTVAVVVAVAVCFPYQEF